MKQLIATTAIVLGCLPALASGDVIPRFSLDPASPSNVGGLTPDDVLRPGPALRIAGTTLGLLDDFPNGRFDNLNEVSFGKDPIPGPLFFSVDRVAIGAPGTAVFAQSMAGVASAAADIFRAQTLANSNVLFRSETDLGLMAGFFGDDVDALELDGEPGTYVYFTIDFLSASNDFGAGTLAKNILFSAGDGAFATFAEGVARMDLDAFDQLDGLVLNDRFEPGVLNPGIDEALFSLSPFSPSTFTTSGAAYMAGVKGAMSPADVLYTDFTGSFLLWNSAAELGLRPDDNLDALDTVVPEPSTGLVALMVTAAGLFVSSYRGRARRSRLFEFQA